MPIHQIGLYQSTLNPKTLNPKPLQVGPILRFATCEDFVTQQILAEALGNLACPEAEEALKFLQKVGPKP